MTLTRQNNLVLVSKTLSRELWKNQTPAEKLLWEHLRNRKLQGKRFLRQHAIFFDLLGTETFFIADFYCHEHGLVVEIDGKIHDYGKDHDQLRTHIMNHFGINVVRVRNDEIEKDVQKVLTRLKGYLNLP